MTGTTPPALTRPGDPMTRGELGFFVGITFFLGWGLFFITGTDTLGNLALWSAFALIQSAGLALFTINTPRPISPDHHLRAGKILADDLAGGLLISDLMSLLGPPLFYFFGQGQNPLLTLSGWLLGWLVMIWLFYLLPAPTPKPSESEPISKELICPGCGARVEKLAEDLSHKCPYCGALHFFRV